MKKTFKIILLQLIITSSFGAELIRKLPVYAVTKPKTISTQIAIGNGIINTIHKTLGEKVEKGTVLMEAFERETVRPYRSTIRGAVAKLHVTEGAAVTPGMPLITIVDPNKKILELSLSPQEGKNVKIGMNLYRLKSSKIFAKIKNISPIIDPDTGAIVAELEPANKLIEHIGQVIPLNIHLKSEKCDLVIKLDSLGKYTQGYKAKFISGNKACLDKI